MYNDNELMNAGVKPKYQIKTIEEIQKHFESLPVFDIWYNPGMGFLKIASYDTAEGYYNNGIITQDQWDAFRVIWRNLTPRFSGVASSFEF